MKPYGSAVLGVGSTPFRPRLHIGCGAQPEMAFVEHSKTVGTIHDCRMTGSVVGNTVVDSAVHCIYIAKGSGQFLALVGARLLKAYNIRILIANHVDTGLAA